MDCLVSSLCGPDRPRTSEVAFGGVDRVVFAFAESGPNRVNGREINYVKAKLCDIRQTCLAIGERAVFTGFGRSRAGEELVPGTEASTNGIHHKDEFAT